MWIQLFSCRSCRLSLDRRSLTCHFLRPFLVESVGFLALSSFGAVAFLSSTFGCYLYRELLCTCYSFPLEGDFRGFIPQGGIIGSKGVKSGVALAKYRSWVFVWKVGVRAHAQTHACAHTRTHACTQPPRRVCDGRGVAPSGHGEQMLVNCSAG